MRARHSLTALLRRSSTDPKATAVEDSSSLDPEGTGAPLAARLASSLAVFAAAVGVALAGGAISAPLAAAESCPNEQLRSENHSLGLPGCRAYELVSPPFKYGEPVADPEHIADAGSSDPRLAYFSLGAFGDPGNDSTSLGSSYAGTRTSTGWASVPFGPSATEFQGNAPDLGAGNAWAGKETVGASPDLSSTLFLQAPKGASPIDSRYYLRHADGSYQEIGPLIDPETVSEWTPTESNRANSPHVTTEGNTADLSHIFFGPKYTSGPPSLNWLWPGDGTVRNAPSLYEYSGIGNNEPELVAVKNQGSLAAAAAAEGKVHLNEAAEQISQCGSVIGGTAVNQAVQSETIDGYDAVSSTGTTVFFTVYGYLGNSECVPPAEGPEADEIYARIGGSETVAISEPTAADCAGCDTSVPAEAIFQGASADGSRVYFLTTQALLPGASGDNLYEYDFAAPAGQRVALVAPEMPEAPEHAGTELQPGGVVRVSEEGGTAYFVSGAVLPGVTANEFGDAPTVGGFNLYARNAESGHTAFVAGLSEADDLDWSSADSRPVEATPDGRFLLFPSTNDLTPDSSGSGNQLYRYDSATGELRRVSVGQAGFNEDGNAVAPPSSTFGATFQGVVRSYRGGYVPGDSYAVSMTSDGSRVFFESPLALTPQALNDACAFTAFGFCLSPAENIYEWHEGQVALISDGRDTNSRLGKSTTELIGADLSGSTVLFTSTDPLVPADGDTQADIYAAVVGGGFPAAPPSAACAEEACQGSPSAPPEASPASSATFNGPGNPPPPHRKPKKHPKKPKKHRKSSHSKKKAQTGQGTAAGRGNARKGR